MFRKTPQKSTVGSQLKDEFISWTIDNNITEKYMNHQGETRLTLYKKLISMEMVKKLFKNNSFAYFAKSWKKANWSIVF